jgi:octaprenyl-diphosphate synthase
MTMDDVFQMFRDDLTRVDEWMEEALRSEVALIPEIGGHLIGSGGKRFRPLLLLASSALCGYEGDRRYPLAAVIEFIHTATLLHDDVIDQAQVRRGKISANNFGARREGPRRGLSVFQAFKLLAVYGDMASSTPCRDDQPLVEGAVLQLVNVVTPLFRRGFT